MAENRAHQKILLACVCHRGRRIGNGMSYWTGGSTKSLAGSIGNGRINKAVGRQHVNWKSWRSTTGLPVDGIIQTCERKGEAESMLAVAADWGLDREVDASATEEKKRHFFPLNSCGQHRMF